MVRRCNYKARLFVLMSLWRYYNNILNVFVFVILGAKWVHNRPGVTLTGAALLGGTLLVCLLLALLLPGSTNEGGVRTGAGEGTENLSKNIPIHTDIGMVWQINVETWSFNSLLWQHRVALQHWYIRIHNLTLAWPKMKNGKVIFIA